MRHNQKKYEIGVSMDQEYEDILFCTDFSDDANFAFLHAVDMCRKYDARLHLMHVVISLNAHSENSANYDALDPDTPKVNHLKEQIVDKIKSRLKRQYEARLSEIKGYQFAVRFGSADAQTIQYARENNIEMIVLGVVGRAGIHKGKMLKTAANVSRYAHCEVVTIGVSR
jgi:nucleotide-binding universal stress UspA family protein